MAASLLKNESLPQSPTPVRDEILARYRHLRAIGKEHHNRAIACLSRDALLQQARRLGLAKGRTLILDGMDELTYVFDLAVYTAPPGRSRAIDRCARSASFAKGSDEGLVLDAMRNNRFAIMIVRRRHEAAGLIVTDIVRNVDIWLVDEGLERSLAAGAGLAIRYYTLDSFAMTAGVGIPLDKGFLTAALDAMPHGIRDKGQIEALQDRRFAATLYRMALAGGVTEMMRYKEAGDTDEEY